MSWAAACLVRVAASIALQQIVTSRTTYIFCNIKLFDRCSHRPVHGFHANIPLVSGDEPRAGRERLNEFESETRNIGRSCVDSTCSIRCCDAPDSVSSLRCVDLGKTPIDLRLAGSVHNYEDNDRQTSAACRLLTGASPSRVALQSETKDESPEVGLMMRR